MSSFPSVAIVGCAGPVGTATVEACKARLGAENVTIVTKSAAYAGSGCPVVVGDYDSVDSLKNAFADKGAVYLIPPMAENRVELMQNGLIAAKEAKVPFILVQSMLTVHFPGTLFGEQFLAVERATADNGVPYAILQLPLFTDILSNQVGLVRSASKFRFPHLPEAQCTSLTAQDAGEVASVILSNPSAHINKTYTAVGPAWTKPEAAAAFTAALHRPVAYEQVSYEAMEKALVDGGMPAWQIKGMMELNQLINAGRCVFHASDFETLTGHAAMSVVDWVTAHAAEFSDAPSSS